jgi:putative ABC transport system permease protein
MVLGLKHAARYPSAIVRGIPNAMKFLPLVWAGLWRKPARTLFTLLSVVVAFVLFGLLQGMNSAFALVIEQQKLDRLFIDPRFPGQPLPRTHLDEIRKVPGITLLTEISFLPGYYQEQTNGLLSINTNPDVWLAIRPEWQHSKEELAAVLRTRTGAMISEGLAKKHGWKVGDTFTMRTGLMKKDGTSDWTFEVLGVMTNPDAPEATNFLSNWSYYDEARTAGSGTVSRFLMRIGDPTRSTQLSRDVDARFANSSSPTRTQSEQAVAQSQVTNIGDVNFFTRAIIGAVFFALLLLTANTMMESVRERTSEIGVLKTFGFSGTRVFALVLTEALSLFVLAALLGLAAAAAAFPFLGDVIGVATLPARVLSVGLAYAVVAALVSAAVPAFRAQRLDVVAALAAR